MLRRLNLSWGMLFILLYCIIHGVEVLAAYYVLDDSNDTVIGEIGRVKSEYQDTLLDIARAHGLGYQDIKLANPGVDTWLPGDGSVILLPLEFILPQAPQVGIVLNIPEMRLYYYLKGSKGEQLTVITYPLGVGREGWTTPYVTTKIIEKKKSPVWIPPASIREEHAQMDDPLPVSVGPGPDNPLGDYALRLGLPQYLIHGTNKPFGIGMRVSHGCIRLYPEHIEKLFAQVELGTPVKIVNQPYKVGVRKDRIYLEAHPYLKEDAEQFDRNMTSVVKMLIKLTEGRPYWIDWEKADRVIQEMRGVPLEIGRFTGPRTIPKPAPAVKMAKQPEPDVQEQKKSQKAEVQTVEAALKLRLETGLRKQQ